MVDVVHRSRLKTLQCGCTEQVENPFFRLQVIFIGLKVLFDRVGNPFFGLRVPFYRLKLLISALISVVAENSYGNMAKPQSRALGRGKSSDCSALAALEGTILRHRVQGLPRLM